MVDDFRNKALRGAAFVIAAYGISQAMRLGGNLILTRLLAPDFFGIMAIAQAFITGLHFFSDIGLRPSIIRSHKGKDPTFLNTAWTIQVIRGFVLWVLTLALALPLSKIYESPVLAWVFPIAGLNAILYGFNSTSIYTLNKDIQLGKLTAMELTGKVIAVLFMITLAYLYKNIWSLVIGSLAGALLTTVWSHFLDPNTKNCILIERDALRELLDFGKWIFISTAMMFLATQADRLLLGKFLPMTLFGVYSIAIIFAELPKEILNQLSNKVIYPLITHFTHLPRNELHQKILTKRKLILFPLAFLVALLGCFGDILIDLLYDDRYQQAGWMLSLLSFGMWPLVLYATIDRYLYAIGKPNYSATGNFLKFVYMIIFVPLFFKYLGITGAVFAVAINDIPVYIVINFGLIKEKMSCLLQDLFATIFIVCISTIFIITRLLFGFGSPAKLINIF